MLTNGVFWQVVFDLEWRNDTTNATAPSTSAVSQRIFAAQEDNLVHGLTALGVGGVIAVPTDTLYGKLLQEILSLKEGQHGCSLSFCSSCVWKIHAVGIPDTDLHRKVRFLSASASGYLKVKRQKDCALVLLWRLTRVSPAGLAASAELTEGVMNLYDIKRRNAKLPLAICLAEAGQVEQYGEAAHLPPGLLEDLLPGPVSVVLRRKQRGWLAEELNPGVPTIGVYKTAEGYRHSSQKLIGVCQQYALNGRTRSCFLIYMTLLAGCKHRTYYFSACMKISLIDFGKDARPMHVGRI